MSDAYTTEQLEILTASAKHIRLAIACLDALLVEGKDEKVSSARTLIFTAQGELIQMGINEKVMNLKEIRANLDKDIKETVEFGESLYLQGIREVVKAIQTGEQGSGRNVNYYQLVFCLQDEAFVKVQPWHSQAVGWIMRVHGPEAKAGEVICDKAKLDAANANS